MNYEELLEKMQGYEKELKDLISLQQRLLKNLSKSTATGDVKAWAKDGALLEEALQKSNENLAAMQSEINGFDCREYIENGEFSEQMLAYCEKFQLDVKGEFPIYEVFPYKVRIDTETLDIYLDGKKVQSLRPYSFVTNVKAGREKLLKASFNPAAFAAEVAMAYDLALLSQNKGKAYKTDSDVYLISLYKFLTPMKRFRKDYDQQSFAFDLARLYSADVIELNDGRKYQFGPSRNIKKAIRILDQDGREQFLATIRFY